MRSGGERSGATFGAALGWLIVATVGAILLTQLFRWTGVNVVAVIQTLTPYLGLLLLPVALIALWRKRYALATAATGVGLGVMVLAAPIAFPDPQADPVAGANGLTVASANLLYLNDRVADVVPVLDELHPDVVVFSEYTREHQAALGDTALARTYDHHVDLVGYGASGIAVWSRFPITSHPPLDTHIESIDVTVDGPDGDVRVVAMHMPTPLSNYGGWQRDLQLATEIGESATEPTLLIGDLNTSPWHPDFRGLLDAGFVDAHIANGAGFSTSWPTTWRIPPFVRLDHALTVAGLVSTEVVDFEIPGSDHRGLMVTVAPAR